MKYIQALFSANLACVIYQIHNSNFRIEMGFNYATNVAEHYRCYHGVADLYCRQDLYCREWSQFAKTSMINYSLIIVYQHCFCAVYFFNGWNGEKNIAFGAQLLL